MRMFRIRVIAAVGLAALAAASLPSAQAHHVPVGPDYQATEKDFDVSHFSENSVNVTNKFLPVQPGTTFTLTGTANRGGGGNAHQVVFTATELTKVVNGVRTQVLWDRDIQEGALAEEELAFWAQDDFGNVWLMGEYPEEHEGNKVSAPSTWLAGNQEATAGILMRANPKLNTSTYKQGNAPVGRVPRPGQGARREPAHHACRPDATTACWSSTSGTRTSSRRTGTSSSTTLPASASSR